MSVLDKEAFMNRLKERIGDDNSDEAVAFIEDMTDTFDDMSNKLSDTTDWKQKYEENDTMWRNKYRERFFTGVEEHVGDNHDNFSDDTPEKPTTFEELFEVKEN